MASSSRVAELPTSRHFFKVMIDDFRTELKIPQAFSCELMGEKKGKAVLTSYKGSWEVEVGTFGQRFHFKAGWADFADNHDLHEGDFLMFKHKGNMAFDVVVLRNQEENIVTGLPTHGAKETVRVTKRCCPT